MANAPIVPVTIIGSHQVLRKKRPRHVTVKVIFGKPIMPNQHLPMPTEKLTELVRKQVVENQKQ